METMTASYAPDLEAPHESRALVRQFLARQGADELACVGEVLMSELVSNVVRHAHSEVAVDVSWQKETLRVEVRDGSSIIPAVVDLADANGGYGLRIVTALSQDWGVRQLDHGKAMWFTLGRN